MHKETAKVFVNGTWRVSQSEGAFNAVNPSTGEALPCSYPISGREETLEALQAGKAAAESLAKTPAHQIAEFLEAFASRIEERRADLVELAHVETGLPKSPRLSDAELPRTTDQLRQAAAAARSGAWRRPVVDNARQIYSCRAPLGGPVVVMGPNNFPFAFNSAAGGDMAAAVAAHNPVIAKANPGHPGVTRLFAQLAAEAAAATRLHPATVQLIYRTSKEVGFELVSHPLVAATAFTGSREAGLRLKAAADKAGKPIYVELSSINPVVLLPGALNERGEKIADEFFSSCTMGSGQLCTNPGFVLLPSGHAGELFISSARRRFCAGNPGVLLGSGVLQALVRAVGELQRHGAEVLCGGAPVAGPGFRFQNTLLHAAGDLFLAKPRELQQEAFGPVSLLVTYRDPAQALRIIESMEGNLTGAFYTHSANEDDADYATLEPALRWRVGRLLNNKMPTGVAVSPAMNHGGPFPAAGHPGFTAVGLPASIERFTALHCYDGVRPDRLPNWLKTP